MVFTNTINNPENKDKLLYNYSCNFLNSQNYILVEREKRKVLSSFLSDEILKKVLSYGSLINFLFFCFLSLIVVFYAINIFLYAIIGFEFSVYFIYLIGLLMLLILGIFLLIICVFLFIIGVKTFKKIKINTLNEYFFMSKLDNDLGLANLFVYLFFLILITSVSFFYNLFGVFVFLTFFSLISIFITMAELISLNFDLDKFFTNIVFNYLSRVNYLNILFYPFLLPIIYIFKILVFIFTNLNKFYIYKSNLNNGLLNQSMFLNFNNFNGIYSNGFYDIIKK